MHLFLINSANFESRILTGLLTLPFEYKFITGKLEIFIMVSLRYVFVIICISLLDCDLLKVIGAVFYVSLYRQCLA